MSLSNCVGSFRIVSPAADHQALEDETVYSRERQRHSTRGALNGRSAEALAARSQRRRIHCNLNINTEHTTEQPSPK